MSATKHTAEPWYCDQQGADGKPNVIFDAKGRTTATVPSHEYHGLTDANAARIVQCINACAKFPDPAAALTDLRALLGQARGLLAEGDTDKADKMLIAALGVLDGEEG